MLIRFIDQILIDRRVYGVGETRSFPDAEAIDLVRRGIAVEASADPAPPTVREAVAARPPDARKAVRKGA